MDGGVAFQKFTDLSSELHSGFADLSSNAYEYIDDVSYEVYTEIAIRSNETTIIDLSINRIDSELTDLSNYTSTELTRQIIDLSSYTSTELTRQVTDLSSYTSNELSREISDLSSETVSNIADLSSLMFHTLSTEISDLSSDTSREIDAVITDVSSYTSSELSREISDLSSETVSNIADLSSLTFHTLSIEISDLSSDTSHEISLVQVLTSYEISDLSSYTSSELSREVADLSSLTFQTLSIEISDLSSDTSHEISLVQVLTSYEISDLSSYTSAELSREVADHSSVVFNTISVEIADLSSETSVNIVDLSSYTSSELSREISDISSETVRDIADLSAAVFTRIRVDISNILAGAPETLDTLKEIADVLGDPNDPSFNLATIINNIVDISANLRNEITRAISVEASLDTNISDLSSYTSSELSREISDLSSETMSDISDLSSLVFGTISLETSDLSGYTSSELSREISDLSSYTSSELSRIVSDLSSYTSSELSREISDLSSETVRDISDLSSIAFHAISVDVLDLSSYASTELTRQITDLSGYTSTELTRQITDLSGYTSMELSREISDLSSQVVRDIIDLSGYTSMELSREIIDLSSETVKDISDLSSLVFETISIDVSENTAVFNIIDASFVTINNLLSTEILDLSSEVLRDISDLSSQVYQTIDDLPWEDTGSYLYTVNASQKVGIGISTPTSTLQLRATDSSGASLMIQSRPVSGTAPAQMFLTDRDESNGSMFNGLGVRYEQTKTFFDNYTLSTSSSQLMTFDHTNSNIGINTTTPTVDFEINGDLKITGSLIDGSGNSFSNLAGAFTDTTGGVELQLFTGATTTNKLYNDNGVLSFNGSSVAPTNLVFPYADGSRNQVLETDGSGNLQWVDNHDIYITPNPLHDTYNGIGYTDIISDLTHGIKFMTYAKLNNKRYVYTVSTDLRQIWRYDLDTTDYIQVAGGTDTIDGGSPVQGHADGYVGTSRFFLISDMKYSPYDNNIYIGNNSTDSGVSNSTLMRLNVYTNYVTTVVSNTEITGYGESHGPTYISFDTSGNVYYGSSSTSYGIKMLNIETMTQSGFIAPNELVPGTTLTWGIVWDNSENGYLIHNHGMSKLTSVGGGDLSYNNYSLYFGTYDYGVNDGGNVDATGSTAEVFYIRDVVKDHDVNSNALYFGTGQHGYLLKKVVPSASDPDLGTVTTLAGKLVEPNQNTTSFTSSDYPTISPTNTNIGQVESVAFDEWGNILFTSRFSSNNTLMFYAGIPYTRTGTQPVLPGDSINTMSDISLNNIQYGEFLMWNGESLVPTQAPNGGRSNTIPNLNFTKSNIKDVSQNMFFNTNSKYLLLDKRITIDKIRVNQKNTRALTIGYNVYINEYYDNSGTLQNVQSKTISNAVVSPVTSGETYGSTIVDISATSFTNRNYLEVLIERSTGYVYTEANNTVARFNFLPYVNQYLNNTDISDNFNGGYNMSVRSINKVIEDGNTGCVIIGDSSDNFIRVPAENGASIDVKSMSFWIKNWTGGYIVDGRNVVSHTQLTSNQYVEYGSANDINAGTGVLKFVNQDNLPYETTGIGGDPSNNSIGLLHKDEWNFVYIEFNSYATFTSANPLLFGTSIYGDGGSYTMKDLRLHSDTILTNDIENLFNNYDDNDVMVELLTTPVERNTDDLADVSAANVLTGEFLKYDGTNYVPTNDVADISSNLSDLSGHVYNMTITDLCDCIVTANSYFIGASTSKGNYTTALGFEVMDQATNGGLEYNTAIGYRSLYNTTSESADKNTAIGSESLYSIGAGSNNTAIGTRAGYSHTASNAVIIGYNASENTSQSSGVAIGVGVVRNKTQSNGVFIGNDSGGGSTTGSGNRNVAIGSSNATGLTSGYDNVIIGAYSSNTMSTGYQNVIIGSNSSSNSSSTNNLPVDIINAVGIGYASYPTASNTIQLGNANHTNINTSASLTLGDVTYPTTDGSRNSFLITDGSGNVSFTNYEVKPHMSNVTFDGSNAIIVEFSRDISNSSNYNPSDFSLVHDGSSIEILSVYENSNNLVLNLGDVNGGSGGSGGSGSSQTDLSSQVYSEDFEDDAYTGSVITAPITSQTGHTGSSTKVLSVAKSASTKWEQTGYTTVKTISWWYKHISKGGSSGYILDLRNSNGSTVAVWTTNNTTVTLYDDLGRTENLYINGVNYSTATYTLTDWNHFCITVAPNWGGNLYWNHAGNPYHNSTQYYTEGYIDDVRFFSDVLTTAQITDLAAGNTGNIPYIFYENFEDQAYTGVVTTATIVSGGHNGSNYALQGGGKNNYNRWKLNSMTYQSVSFWYYRDKANSGSKYESLYDNNRSTNGTNLLFFLTDAAKPANNDKVNFTSTSGAVAKLYINGVDQSSAITTGWEASFTPITYADNTWHHFYLEFGTATNMPTTFGTADDGGNGYASQYNLWSGGGKFDEVKFFDSPRTTTQIAELAATGDDSSSGGGDDSSSGVDVPIDLDKLKFTYTKSVDGSNNIVTTDGFTLGSFYYNGLGLTNIRNEELTDLSDISLNSTTLTSGHMIQYNGTQFTNIEPTIGDISFNGDLLPDVTNTRDIGSTSRKIKDIHVAGTVTTDQLSVGTATYPNAYGNTNQFLRANNTGTLYWSHVYLNDLYDVNTTSLANEHFLSYNSTSSSWLVSTLPNDNSANIVTLNSQVTDISNYTIALSAEISDLSNDTTEIISDLSSLVFSTLSTEIYDLSQETINDMADLSSVLHQRIYNDISAVIGGAGPALDTLKELEDYVTGLSGNTVGALITDLIDLSNGVPRQFNDLNDVSTAAITAGKLVKWDGNHFTETQLLYDEGSSGYIGIGTNSPAYPLTVDSYTTSNISNIGYLDQSGVALKQQQTDAQISIYASKGIWSGTSFFASSDMRIKQNIVDLIPDDCMELVKQLRPKRYGFVDHIKHGGREVYGFIAQEVQQICPDVVTKQTEFVPDIFKATEHISWSKVNKKWKLTIHDANITFKENTTVRFYVSDRKNSEIMKDVSNCKNDSKSFVFNKIYEDIFVYGHKVDNFLALDKEQLFTLHHGAILTLDNHQETITNDVTDLKRENGELKARVEELEHQLDLIKGHLGI